MIMVKDKYFLIWLRNRLIEVYGEPPLVDFVHKLNKIIENYPGNKES